MLMEWGEIVRGEWRIGLELMRGDGLVFLFGCTVGDD